MRTRQKNRSSDETELSYDDLWVVKFLNQKENRFLERIHDNFLADRFNFLGIKEKVEDFDRAYKAIRDYEESQNIEAESVVYLLAHQRYIYTKTGLDSILDKVLNREFGTCHRYGCEDVPYIPTGLSNEPRKAGTMVFCYNCESLYEPRGSLKNLDGSAWGVGFAHFLILLHSYHFEKKTGRPQYVPRIFGFKLSKRDESDSG